MRENKNKNPLYAVTNGGRDVEEVQGVFSLWKKKLGLDPLVELIEFLLKSLVNMVSSYVMFTVVLEFFENYILQIKLFLSKLGIGPIAAYPVK